MTPLRDLRALLALLRKEGELVEIACEVDWDLEAAEVHRRVIAAGGPALLFKRIKGSPWPLVTNRARPFFLYLAYIAPHAQLDAPDDAVAEYRGQFPEPAVTATGGKNQSPAPLATYAAMVTRLDRGVGRVLDQLRALGLEENTVVFFCSDNGAPDRAGIPQFFGSTLARSSPRSS